MKKGAIFDMDGTLFDTERLYHESWDIVAVKLGQTVSSGFKEDISGTCGDSMKRVIKRHYPALDPDALIAACLNRVQEIERTQVPEKAGVRPLLEYLQTAGVRMAVASGSPIAMIENNLRVAGIRNYFSAVVSGLQVAHGKPSPDIFLCAAEKLRIEPKDCYVFEDSPNGVRAGAAAGCATVMIPDLTPPTNDIRRLAVSVCSDFYEVKKSLISGLF